MKSAVITIGVCVAVWGVVALVLDDDGEGWKPLVFGCLVAASGACL